MVFSVRRVSSVLCTGLCAMMAFSAQAQERSAAGATDTQMTWSALKSLVDKANAESQGAHTRIDQMVACTAKSMFYAPDVKGADKTGCISNADIDLIKGCGAKGQVLDGDTKKCRMADVEVKDLRMKVQSFSRAELGAMCGSGSHACSPTSLTISKICKVKGFEFASGVSVGNFDSPKDNWLGRWTGKAWQVFNARDDNRWISNITCQKFYFE